MSIGVQRAVVVEDNARFRDLIKLVLESLGVEAIDEANDGQEALEVLQRVDAGLVIIDWTMDGMDGMACTRHIRSGALGRNSTVPIVMVSGHGGEDVVRHAEEAGVDVYIAKPISIKALFAGIQGAISGRRSPIP